VDLDDDDTLVSIKDLTLNLEQSGKIKFNAGLTGTEGTYCKLPVGTLTSERKYQRFLSKNTIQNAKSINLELLQPLVVWRRPSGANVVVDGQHKGVMSYLGMGIDFEVPCIVYEHPKNRSIGECIEVEAQMFEKLNMSRKNVSGLDKYRAGIAYGDKEALEFESMLVSLGVFVENLGDIDFGVEVRGWVKLRSAYAKYNLKHTKNAVDFLKPIYLDKEKWAKDYVDGSMVFALAAIFNLLDNYLGPQKKDGLKKFLKNYFHKTTANKWTANSAGNTDYIMIARRIVDKYNFMVESDIIEGSVIGPKVLEDAGLPALDKLK
jgi:hypothetical protein